MREQIFKLVVRLENQFPLDDFVHSIRHIAEYGSTPQLEEFYRVLTNLSSWLNEDKV